MTTTLYCPVPFSKISAQGYDITQAGTAVPDNLVAAIVAAAYTAGVVLTSSAGGTAIIQSGRSYSSGTGPPSGDSFPLGWEMEDSTGATFVKKGDGTWSAAQSGTFAPSIPTAGSFTYDGSGNPLTDPDGNTYTWNTDGTPHTQTKGGVTRTFNWNADGTLASVS